MGDTSSVDLEHTQPLSQASGSSSPDESIPEKSQDTPSNDEEPAGATAVAEEVLDLDYDEDSQDGRNGRSREEQFSDGEIIDSPEDTTMAPDNKLSAAKEDGEKSSDGKECDLEDGELTDSDDDIPKPAAATSASGTSERKPPISARLSRPGQNAFCNKVAQFVQIPLKNYNRQANPRGASSGKLSAWERGLRDAREAMRRASKVREEPDFETKRLVAAPCGDRVSQRHESDSDDTKPSRLSRSPSITSASSRRIPSLLDLHMSPPRSFRKPPKELGPQVIYPNGRPDSSRRDRVVGGGGRRRRERETPPGPPRRRSPDHARRATPPGPHRDNWASPPREVEKKVGGAAAGLSPVRDASPISSDTDTYLDGKQDYSSKKFSGAMSNVSDPWARKKKTQIVAEKAKERVEKRGRSVNRSPLSSRSSSGSSAGSEAKRSRRNRKRRRETSSSSSDSSSSQNTADRSPPRGDISSFRIPKKRSSAGVDSSHNTNQRRNAPQTSYRNQVDDFFAKRASDTPAAFRPRGKNRSSKLSESSTSRSIGIPRSKEAQTISDSDDSEVDRTSRSRSSSQASSSSSKSSKSRSGSESPALPAKYRVTTDSTQSRRSPSPISDDDNLRTLSSKDLKSGNSSPPPPPPPPPVEKYGNGNRGSVTPPPPPPMESQGRSRRRDESGAVRVSSSSTSLSKKELRRRELLEQLRVVEAELQRKKEASAVEGSS